MGNLVSWSAVPAQTPSGLKTLYSAVRVGNIGQLDEMIADRTLSMQDVMCAQDQQGVTALHVAAEHGRLKCVLHLLKKYGVNPYLEDKSSMTPLHVAASAGHADIVEILLDHMEKLGYCNLDEKDVWGWTPFHRAVINCRWDVAKILMDKGASVRTADQSGQMALHVVASYGNVSLTGKLMEAGSPINKQDTRGRTPLYLATLPGHNEVIEEITKSGNCDVNLAAHTGVTPLTLAAQNGDTSSVETLLRRGACCHSVHLPTRGFRFPPVELALDRAGNRQHRHQRELYLNCAVLLIQAEGFSPTSVAFHAAYRCLLAGECPQSLRIMHMLFLAGVWVELQLAMRTRSDPTIHKWSTTYMKQCLPLVELCRRKIRHHVQSLHHSSNLSALVDRLSLPKRLADIVMLRDI